MIFKNEVLKSFDDLEDCCSTTMINTIKNDLHLSYKKLYRLHPKMRESANIINLSQWAYILEKIQAAGIELIYFDEFSVYSRHFGFRGWSK